MKTIAAIPVVLAALLFVSCQENIETPQEYSWTASEEIPDFDYIHKFKIANGTLYMAGTVDGSHGIFMLTRKKWTQVAETFIFADDFTVYKGVLYFGNYNGFYRVVNSEVEKITTNDPQVFAMDVFEDKLVIMGASILIDDKYYTTASFDGTNFTPMSEYVSGYSMMVAGDKLFVGNYPVAVLDQTGFSWLGIGGQSNMTTDSEGNIYIASIAVDAENKTQSTIQKQMGSESITLGGTLDCYVHSIQSFESTIIVTGFTTSGKGVSYYYKNDKWNEIKISNIVRQMILFHDKIIALPSISGQVLELK